MRNGLSEISGGLSGELRIAALHRLADEKLRTILQHGTGQGAEVERAYHKADETDGGRESSAGAAGGVPISLMSS